MPSRLASTPAAFRDDIMQRLEAGEQALTAKAIEARLWQVRVETRQAERDAKLTPEERKRQAKAKRDAETRRQREHEKWLAEQGERDARRKALAAELATILVPLLDDDAYSRVYKLIHDVSPIDMREALIRARGTGAPSDLPNG